MTSEYVDAGKLFDNEGDSAASCQKNTPFATCKALCDNTPGCLSFAHYAVQNNGFCCPKKKCGSEDEPLKTYYEGRTYYKPCTRAPSSSPTDAPTGTPSFAQVWSWTLEDSADTGEIVFLDDEQVTAVNEYINRGLELVIRSDLVLHKSRNDSTDSSFIQFIDLDDGNKIKTWRMNSGTEDYLQIDYDANSDNTIIKCRDNSGKCSPLVDGDRSVVLIKVRFNPRGGSAHNSEWWRNRFTMTGSHYAVELPLTQRCTSGYSASWGAEWNAGNLGGIVLSWYAMNGFRPANTLNPFKSVAYKSHANCESACNQDAASFYNVLPGYYCRCYTSKPSLADSGSETWEFCSM